MKQYLTPVLSQFGRPAKDSVTPPAVEISMETGLAYRIGVNKPLIEEILNDVTSWYSRIPSETVLSEIDDQDDPDLVRGQLNFIRNQAETLITRGDHDERDPDLIRHNIYSVRSVVETYITKNDTDEDDPDLIRAGRSHLRPYIGN